MRIAIPLLHAVAVSTLTVLCATATHAVAQGDEVALERSKPRMLENAVHVGPVDESQKVTISVYLKFRNTDDLNQLVEDQQTPGNDRYQKYLTPEEFHQKYSPLPADVAKVKGELVRMGFRIVDAPAGGLFITATGTVGQVKLAFHVSQELYTVRGKTVRSHGEAPTVPADIAPLVLHIAGLDDAKKFITTYTTTHPGKKIGPNADPAYRYGLIRFPCNPDYLKPDAGTITPAAYTESSVMEYTNCGYTPSQVSAAYGANSVKWNGTGVRVGVVDLYVSNTLEQDINQYSSNHNLPQLNETNFQEIYPAGLDNVSNYDPCGPQSWEVEETLDVEAVHGIAPGADIVYIGDACNSNYPLPMQAMYSAIDNKQADILSGSFGGPEIVFPTAQVDADNQEFEQAAALGITVMFSSGDSSDYIPDGTYTAVVSWPASSPWVTAVGGTALLLNQNGAGTKAEYGWANYGNGAYADTWTGQFDRNAEGWGGWSYMDGGGGGTSMYMAQPSYQKHVVPTSLAENINTIQTAGLNLGKPNRVLPDVAMLADPYTGFLQGETFLEYTPGTPDIGCVPVSSPANAEYCEFQQGGTSVASPLFAGVMAVVDSALLTTKKPLIGFANPALYKLSVGNSGSSAPIWDVTPPTQPVALIDEEENDYGNWYLGAVSINMDPVTTDPSTTWILGGDSSLMTTKGFDNVTGLGTPWLPGLIKALAPGAK